MACVCETCRFLMSEIINDDMMDTCEHGFPDEICVECEDDTACTLTCEFYEGRPDEEWETVPCSVCGKELRQLAGVPGKVYCPDCYLSNK